MEVAVPDGGLQSFQSPQFLVSERDRFLGQRLQPLGGADYPHGHALAGDSVRDESAVLISLILKGLLRVVIGTELTGGGLRLVVVRVKTGDEASNPARWKMCM